MNKRTDAFVGIDVAFAKRKRLPICICTEQGSQLKPISIPLDISASRPRGHGNRATFDLAVVNAFADDVAAYFRKIEHRLGVAIRRIAIDAPYAPAEDDVGYRQCEAAFRSFGTNAIFKTPSRTEFEQICAKAKSHLYNKGAESRFPNANRLWMLVGFALFQRLQPEWECIEVYPYATMRSLGAADVHKRKAAGITAQLAAVSCHTGWPTETGINGIRELSKLIGAPGHDAVDAYASAWIAALEPPDRLPIGCPPHDAIWVPGHRFCVSSPSC